MSGEDPQLGDKFRWKCSTEAAPLVPQGAARAASRPARLLARVWGACVGGASADDVVQATRLPGARTGAGEPDTPTAPQRALEASALAQYLESGSGSGRG